VGEHINKAKGNIKQAVGNATGNKKLEREGVKDELAGKAQGAAKDVKKAASHVKHAAENTTK
jgi:uncharacterized protein YjbJ (UPF0337 family)